MPNPNHDRRGRFSSAGNRGSGKTPTKQANQTQPPTAAERAAWDDEYGPMPATRYKGIDKPNPTLDEVLTPKQKKAFQDAFTHLNWPPH